MSKLRKEELLEGYWPCELILLKDKIGYYRFAINHLDGSMVKVIGLDFDFYPDEACYADFSLTDPNNMCFGSHNNPTKPFMSHYVKDFHFGKGYDNDIEFTAVQHASHEIMWHQDEKGIMSVEEILDAEERLNEKIKNLRDIQNREDPMSLNDFINYAL